MPGNAEIISAFCKARHRNIRISTDAYFRDDLFATKEERNRTMLPFLLKADVLKLSVEELQALAKESNVALAVSKLQFNGLLLITKGAEGSEAFFEGKRVAIVPSTPVEKIVDTTGAGDAFFGAALALIDRGASLDSESLKQVLTVANRSGAAATQTEGAL